MTAATSLELLQDTIAIKAPQATTFSGFVVDVLRSWLAEPNVDLTKLVNRRSGPNWKALAKIRVSGEPEEDPREDALFEWARQKEQFERHVLHSGIEIFHNPSGQGMTSDSLGLRSFVTTDELVYFYWATSAEVLGDYEKVWFAHHKDDQRGRAACLIDELDGLGGLFGAVVFPDMPEVERAAERISEECRNLPWAHGMLEGYEWQELDENRGEAIAVAVGVSRDVARQAIRELLETSKPADNRIAWAIYRSTISTPPRTVEDLYANGREGWRLWP